MCIKKHSTVHRAMLHPLRSMKFFDVPSETEKALSYKEGKYNPFNFVVRHDSSCGGRTDRGKNLKTVSKGLRKLNGIKLQPLYLINTSTYSLIETFPTPLVFNATGSEQQRSSPRNPIWSWNPQYGTKKKNKKKQEKKRKKQEKTRRKKTKHVRPRWYLARPAQNSRNHPQETQSGVETRNTEPKTVKKSDVLWVVCIIYPNLQLARVLEFGWNAIRGFVWQTVQQVAFSGGGSTREGETSIVEIIQGQNPVKSKSQGIHYR